ncbi:hypothetical protein [Brachybacterium fresconis]|uniref:Uncharacterized protein n=1 Tax=Brachybacterium fresconis TaxID=173363 RepID=A0ABS4YHJ3_9MICO|nr:hypothetical protein [Brachybacterium fresconis]MBP2408265.1 hypothetical protein [Brachybacterium fresconis]
MTTTTNEKTPSADLAGCRAEGLESTPIKEIKMNSTIVSAAVPTRIQLDEFAVIDVDPRDENAEITFSSRNEFGETRTTFGIALAPEEARKLASALLDASAPDLGSADAEEIEEHVAVARKMPVNVPVSELAAGTVTDIFRWAQDHDMGSGDVMAIVEDYIDGVAEAECMSPAKVAAKMREAR